jgi:hypothetical protein
VSPNHPASGTTGILLTILNDSAGQGSADHDIVGQDSESPGLFLLLDAEPDRLARAGERIAAAGITASGERLVAAFDEAGVAGANVAAAVTGRADVGPAQAQDLLQLPVAALDAPTPRRATYSPAQARLSLGPTPARSNGIDAHSKKAQVAKPEPSQKRVTRIELALSAWEATALDSSLCL